jgi:hypothetical protein
MSLRARIRAAVIAMIIVSVVALACAARVAYLAWSMH